MSDEYTLDGDIFNDLRSALRGTIDCWVMTRINGASASLACDQAPVDIGLLRYLDGRFGHLVVDHPIGKPWESDPTR